MTTPSKPSSPRSSPVIAARGHRGGQVAGKLGHAQVAGHDGGRPGLDRGDERGQVTPPQVLQGALDGGDGQVTVRLGPAVAGKVLGARGHPRVLQPGHRRRGVPGHQVRVRAERAGAHGRAVRGTEHVGTGREVEVDAQRRQVPADRQVHRAGHGHVVHRAERGVPRVGTALRERDPGDVAAFLVDRDDRFVRRGRAQRGGQDAHLIGGGDVLAEQRDAAQAALERPQDPARSRGPGERRDEDRVGQAEQARVGARPGARPRRRVVAHPFTAPATRPAARRRWTSRKKAMTGIVNSVEAAMIGPHWAPFLP